MNVFLRTVHCRRLYASTFVCLRLAPFYKRLTRDAIVLSFSYSTQASASVQKSFSPSENLSHAGRVPQVPYGFRELGIRDSIAKAINKAFPDVQRPTIAQADFIPAILNGKDVVLHDDTGTGKSFGSIVALLNRPRARPEVRDHFGACITSLVIVPHRDLGHQMIHWIDSILEHSGSNHPPIDVIAQLVARGDPISLDEQTRKLRTTPPHILIGTPQALWEIYDSDREALQFENLATAVIDEVDYLLDIPPPYVRKSRESAAWRNFKKHPSLARQLLEVLLPERKPGAVPPGWTTVSRPLQLVMSSATVHSNLIDFLCDARWLAEDRVILSGKQLLKANSHMLTGQNAEKPRIVHHAFVVSSDGGLQNADFAVRPGEESEIEGQNGKATLPDLREKLQKMQSVPSQSPTSPVVMEAIATVFAFDVPRVALLVIPPGSSVRKSILELQDLGIDARPLDLRSRHIEQMINQEEGAEPILLVATPATIRGVDLPQLTHVFCAGAPDTASADVFKHVSGRVGRFGREGKVMTFVTEREIECRDGVVRTTKNPAGLLKAFYRRLCIKPVWFDLSAVGIDS